MSNNNSIMAKCGVELTASMTGSAVPIGTLPVNPVIIIFDNQGSASVAISTNGGSTTWRTFVGGEALVLDLRGNKGDVSNFTFPVGTVFTGTGASGTFSISYLYGTGNA